MAHFIYKKLSFLLVRLGFSVHNLLGPGLLESAYGGKLPPESMFFSINLTRNEKLLVVFLFIQRKTT